MGTGYSPNNPREQVGFSSKGGHNVVADEDGGGDSVI